MLAKVPAFATLSEAVRHEMAARMGETSFPASATVVTEGEPGDLFYLIVEGQAEASMDGPDGPIALASLAPGDLFGEIAVLTSGTPRQATVVARTRLRTLTLAAADLTALLASVPAARAALEQGAERALVVKLLARTSPFVALSSDHLWELATRLERVTLPAGVMLMQHGELGERCFLLREGRVEVLADNGQAERRLATLGPGTLVGETALLTAAPRNATVRTLEPSVVLALRREDLLDALAADPRVAAALLELLQLRQRPRQADGIVVQSYLGADGEPVTVLTDPARGAYHRLSPRGRFIWERLDGHHTVRDLTLDYLTAFGAFAPQVIAATIAGLAAAGFAAGPRLAPDVVALVTPPLAVPQRVVLLARRLLTWQVALRGVDGPLSRFHARIGRHFFTRPGLLLLGLVTVAGLGACALAFPQAEAAVRTAASQGVPLLFWLPAVLAAVVLHETGHALTVKACGRAVHRVGIGWYWCTPIAFVDTSDMWAAGRGPRVAVGLAGPATNVLLGSLVALIASLAPAGAAAVLWPFALVNYAMALVNLNPLLDYDGYYVLSDLLERPNLRAEALAWLGHRFPLALRHPRELRTHLVELGYGLASLLFVALMAAVAALLYRLTMEGWLARSWSAQVATGLAWGLAGAVVLVSLLSVLGEPHPPRRPDHPGKR